jgi:hypothetical protein
MPIIGNPIYQSAFVVDQFSGNGSTVAFTMSVAPAGVTNVLVAVSGVLQDPSTYGVVGNTITFSAAPPSGTGNISCRYLGVPVTGVTTTAYRTVTEFTATASQTTFTPPSYNVGFINVYLNGVLLGSADYTATNGTTVVLAIGASAGNLLTVESFLISSVANAISNSAGSVSNSNLATGAVTSDKIANGVTINFADGSASTPSITNDGDTNTGIFFPAADTIAFAEGGVEAMRLDASGNVGIGTNSPSAKLNVVNGDVTFITNDANGYARFTQNSGSAQLGLFRSGTTVGGGYIGADGNNCLDVRTGTFDTRLTVTQAGLLQFNSGYGSVATAYGCRAWVNFNGNSYAIRGSGNVSSITNMATGINRINFTNAMPDTNYSVSGFSASDTLSNSYYGGDPWVGSTTFCYLWSNYNATSYNLDWCGVQVFR